MKRGKLDKGKLKLNAETVRRLHNAELEQAAGAHCYGTNGTSSGVDTYCNCNLTWNCVDSQRCDSVNVC